MADQWQPLRQANEEDHARFDAARAAFKAEWGLQPWTWSLAAQRRIVGHERVALRAWRRAAGVALRDTAAEAIAYGYVARRSM